MRTREASPKSATPTRHGFPSRRILGVRVDAIDYAGAVQLLVTWARAAESRYVCVSPVHAIMEAYQAPDFRDVVERADLVTPDGMPLVWCLRLLGVRMATRVYGPSLTEHTLAVAEKAGVPVGFYGGSQETLDRLVAAVRARYPRLAVVYASSPPFRQLTPEEDADVVGQINASRATILFVGLGCPKQERWMGAHRGRTRAVLVGVGAAFDFLAGTKRQAPAWMQRSGLEWLFRLCQEPRRLRYRYLKHNPRFLALFALQYLGLRRFR